MDEESVLFKEWESKRPNLVKDGITDKNTYLKSKTKILFILKEVNGGDNWDLREYLKDGARKQTWNNIALWTFGIKNNMENYSWVKLKNLLTDNFRKEQLKSIAAINLKKDSGTHTANSNKVWKYAEEDKFLLREQIKLYNPDLIICCGSPTSEIVKYFQLVDKFDNWKLSSYGIKYHLTKDCKILINYCHPEARIDDNYKYYPIIQTIKELKIINSKLSL